MKKAGVSSFLEFGNGLFVRTNFYTMTFQQLFENKLGVSNFVGLWICTTLYATHTLRNPTIGQCSCCPWTCQMSVQNTVRLQPGKDSDMHQCSKCVYPKFGLFLQNWSLPGYPFALPLLVLLRLEFGKGNYFMYIERNV